MVESFSRLFRLLILAVFLLVVFLPSYTKIQELRDRNRDLQDKIRKLHVENALLEHQITRIENDPAYYERIAREKMGVVRKGEIPVKVIQEEKQ